MSLLASTGMIADTTMMYPVLSSIQNPLSKVVPHGDMITQSGDTPEVVHISLCMHT